MHTKLLSVAYSKIGIIQNIMRFCLLPRRPGRMYDEESVIYKEFLLVKYIKRFFQASLHVNTYTKLFSLTYS